MLKQLLILTAFGIITPNAVLSQKNNRVSVQSGIVNCFFDGSPSINKPGIGDFLIDVKGIELMRRIKKSNITLEYMSFNGAYEYKLNFGSAVATPQSIWKQLKFFSCFYNRELPFNDKWSFQYGIGSTYFFGDEALYHYSFN